MADREQFKVHRRKTRRKANTRSKTASVPERAKRKNGRAKHLALRLAAVAVAALLVLLVAVNWENLSPASIGDWLSDVFSTAGDGFPVETDGSSISAMKEVNHSLVLLSDTSLTMMNRNGGEKHRFSSNYSNPLLRSNGKYTLVAELGGMRYTVYSRSKEVLKVTADNVSDDAEKTEVLDEPLKNRIISADIREDGMVALVTEASQSHTTEVRVYSVKGKKIFQLKNATLMATDVAMSPDRQTLTVVGVQTKKGQLQSVVRIYDFSNADLLHERVIEDTMLFSVSYFSSGNVFATGDTMCVTVDPNNGKVQTIDFSKRELVTMDMDGSNCVLVLRDLGQMDGGDMLFVSSNGTVQKSHAFTGVFRDVAIKNKTAYLLTEGRLYAATAADGVGEGVDVPQDGRMVAPFGGQVIVAGLTQLSAHTP